MVKIIFSVKIVVSSIIYHFFTRIDLAYLVPTYLLLSSLFLRYIFYNIYVCLYTYYKGIAAARLPQKTGDILYKAWVMCVVPFVQFRCPNRQKTHLWEYAGRPIRSKLQIVPWPKKVFIYPKHQNIFPISAVIFCRLLCDHIWTLKCLEYIIQNGFLVQTCIRPDLVKTSNEPPT